MGSADPLDLPSSSDTDWAWKLIVACVISFGAAFVVICLRAYVRVRIVKIVGWDDWIMFFACLMALCATVVELLAVRYGLGRHTKTQSLGDVAMVNLLIDLTILFCNLSLAFGKISICASILRILQQTMRTWTKGVIWSLIVLSLCVNLAASITVFAQCSPTARSWDKRVKGTCLPPNVNVNMQMFQAATSAFTDILLSLLPILILRRIKLSGRSKMGLQILMGLGILTGMLAIIRLVYTKPDAALEDALLTDINVLIWAALERNFALLLASLPTLMPLRKGWSKLTGSFRMRMSGYSSRRPLGHKSSQDSESVPSANYGRQHSVNVSSGGQDPHRPSYEMVPSTAQRMRPDMVHPFYPGAAQTMPPGTGQRM